MVATPSMQITPERLEERVRIFEQYLRRSVVCTESAQYGEIARALMDNPDEYAERVQLLRSAGDSDCYRRNVVKLIRETCGYEVEQKPQEPYRFIPNPKRDEWRGTNGTTFSGSHRERTRRDEIFNLVNYGTPLRSLRRN
ncbi:hypothetical protein HZA99_05525 [Candidatus Woesearchaeota archaeon]|nr:hypothetical protein [Candidatus Woesearchaeota archaeon]